MQICDGTCIWHPCCIIPNSINSRRGGWSGWNVPAAPDNWHGASGSRPGSLFRITHSCSPPSLGRLLFSKTKKLELVVLVLAKYLTFFVLQLPVAAVLSKVQIKFVTVTLV